MLQIKALVYEAITLSVWRFNVFPLLSKAIDDKENIFPIFVLVILQADEYSSLHSSYPKHTHL